MKFIIFLLFTFNIYAFTDQKVGGTIINQKYKDLKPTKKSLIVISVFSDKKILLAMTKMNNPKFPQAFVVTPKNIIRPDLNLEGPVKVIAKYYPDGEGGKNYTAADLKNDFSLVGKKDIQLEIFEEGH